MRPGPSDQIQITVRVLNEGTNDTPVKDIASTKQISEWEYRVSNGDLLQRMFELAKTEVGL